MTLIVALGECMCEAARIADEITRLADNWHDLLLSVPAATAHEKPSPERWSISEVVGHLVDSACNNHQRFVRALSVDTLEFPHYEQNHWVSVAHYRNCDWGSLVRLWCEYNRMLAGLIGKIPPDRFDVPCTITPYDTCTLGFLISDYLQHLQHHLDILDSRITSD